ncbi:MAG: dienelactone hydrolase family protein [Pirellulaceae bacterium]
MSRSMCVWAATMGIVLVGASLGAAQPPERLPPGERLEKTPRHHEWVDATTVAGNKIRSLLVFPEVKEPVTAVVVIHENRGLNEWARSLTDQVAECGYVAIAPDLLSGKGPEGGGTDSFATGDDARTALYALSDQEVREALDAATQKVRDLEATTDKVVVIGFCWGGGKAFDYAAHNENISAACVFYGSAPAKEVLQKIKVPVYGFYGGNDFRITGEVPAVRDAMKQWEKTFDPVVYEGAGHGFMRAGEESTASEANRQGRDEAWKRLLDLLKQVSA